MTTEKSNTNPDLDLDNVNAIREQMLKQKATEDEIFNQDDDKVVLKPEFIRDCLYNNERGDGLLFAALSKNKYIHVKNNALWLSWAGHHWEIDKMDLFHNAVDCCAIVYLEQAGWHKDQAEKYKKSGDEDKEKANEAMEKKYRDRVYRLRGMRGAKNCLDWSHRLGPKESLAIVGDELDQKPWLLACRNGVLDLKTGKLGRGKPSDLLVKAIPIDWKGIDAPCPTWKKFMLEIHEDDAEVVAFVRRLLGYSITGLTTEHFIACFVGEGRNGKGTMFETLMALMGELAWSVSAELILEQKMSRSSAGPSPDLLSLRGRRFVIASESDRHRRISDSQVKKLTGADTICARAPHDRFETNFQPTHKLFLYTNHIPKGLTDDFALYKRLLFIKYPLKFIDDPDPKKPTERPRDPDLPAKLASEASGILAWLVEGCLEWQEKGLDPPVKIRADVDDLKVKEDTFQQFFNDWLVADPSETIRFKDIYEKFSSWYLEEIDESKRYILTRKSVGAWLDARGFENSKPGGHATRSGLRLKTAIDFARESDMTV